MCHSNRCHVFGICHLLLSNTTIIYVYSFLFIAHMGSLNLPQICTYFFPFPQIIIMITQSFIKIKQHLNYFGMWYTFIDFPLRNHQLSVKKEKFVVNYWFVFTTRRWWLLSLPIRDVYHFKWGLLLLLVNYVIER